MLPPLGVDMYLPAFLNIAADLHVAPEQVQHTLTSFTFGMAAGQLFWGPVGDSYGRKPIILLGVIVSAITASHSNRHYVYPEFHHVALYSRFFWSGAGSIGWCITT